MNEHKQLPEWRWISSVYIETTMRPAISVSLLCLVAASIVVGAPTRKEEGANWKHCDHICENKTYSPVCAVDETGVTKTFDNKCEVDLAICLKTGYFAIVTEGVCL